MHGIARSTVAALLAAAAGSALAAPPTEEELLRLRAARETGLVLEGLGLPVGCVIDEPPPDLDAMAQRGGFEAPFTTILNSGPPSNRVDFVLVGDGYQAAQLGSYAAHCNTGLSALLNTTPFQEYRNFFNVHRVDVVSTDSGVDNDPTQGIFRTTALDMNFWCGGTERLLCVNVGKATLYAQNAPQVDQILAVANSSKYGGAGYPSNNLGTYSGANGSAPEIAIHELGHSLGDLADEYDYGGPTVWTGGEPGPKNVSILTQAQMIAQQKKWWQWLGEPDVAGLCGRYEGANYSEIGIWRPTPDSKMRVLGVPFNHISIETIILSIYQKVSLIDSATPSGTYPPTADIVLDLVYPTDHALTITWFLDGDPIPGADDGTLDLSYVPLADGENHISVLVVDDTPMVRDEAARAQWMTESRAGWTVIGLLGDINGDCDVDTADLGGLIGAFGFTGPFADVNSDGVVDTADLGLVLANFGQSCN